MLARGACMHSRRRIHLRRPRHTRHAGATYVAKCISLAALNEHDQDLAHQEVLRLLAGRWGIPAGRQGATSLVSQTLAALHAQGR